MARNRLQQTDGAQQYGDYNAPTQGGQYGGNQYAQPAGNQYAQSAGNQYAQPAGGNAYAQAAPSYPPAPSAQSYGTAGYGQQTLGYDSGAPTPSPGGGDFWAELTSTKTMLDELESAVQSVREAHQATLNTTDPNAMAQAQRISDEAGALREQCNAAVKRLFKSTKGDKAAKNQAQTTKKRFQTILEEHSRIEKEYRQKSRERAERQFRIVKPEASPEEVREVIDSDNPQVFAQALLSTGRHGQARSAFREVQDRHVELQKLNKTMTELAQMINELSMLVEQQDEAITQVEQNAYNVHTDIEQGNKQVDSAIAKARAARKKKWICFWIVVVILIIVAIIVGVKVGIDQANKK